MHIYIFMNEFPAAYYVIIGVLFGIVVVYVVEYFMTAKYEKHLIQDIVLDAGETRLPFNPVADGCPECGYKKVTVEYVNPLFKTGNYYTCVMCGWRGDAVEDDDGKNWEQSYEGIDDENQYTEGISTTPVEDVPNVYKKVKI